MMSSKGSQEATFQSWYFFYNKEKTSRTDFGRNRIDNLIRGFYLMFTTGSPQYPTSEKQFEDRKNRNHTEWARCIKGQLVKQKLSHEKVGIFVRRWDKVLRKQRIKRGFDIEQVGPAVQINQKVLWRPLSWWRLHQNSGIFIFSAISVLNIPLEKFIHKKCIRWVRNDDSVLRVVWQRRMDFR